MPDHVPDRPAGPEPAARVGTDDERPIDTSAELAPAPETAAGPAYETEAATASAFAPEAAAETAKSPGEQAQERRWAKAD